MRQVLIEKSDNIGEISFNKTVLKAHQTLILEPGNNRLNLPFKLKVIQGGPIKFKYTISRELASKSILLVAAFEDGDELEVWLINFSDSSVTLPKDTPMVEIAAYETVNVRQVQPGLGNGGVIIIPSEARKPVVGHMHEPAKKPRKPRKKS